MVKREFSTASSVLDFILAIGWLMVAGGLLAGIAVLDSEGVSAGVTMGFTIAVPGTMLVVLAQMGQAHITTARAVQDILTEIRQARTVASAPKPSAKPASGGRFGRSPAKD